MGQADSRMSHGDHFPCIGSPWSVGGPCEYEDILLPDEVMLHGTVDYKKQRPAGLGLIT